LEIYQWGDGFVYYNFNPKLIRPFNAVHPLHVKDVLKLAKKKFPSYVDYILLFGGSLDLTCDLFSDIDLYVISSEDPMFVQKCLRELIGKLSRPYDLLVSSLDDFLEESKVIGTVEFRILEKGVCIYAKK